MMKCWVCCHCVYAVFIYTILADVARGQACLNTFQIDSNYTTGCSCDLTEYLASCSCKTLVDAFQHVPLQTTNCERIFTYNVFEDQEVNDTTVLYPWTGTINFVGHNHPIINCTGNDVGWNFYSLVSVSIQNFTFINCSHLRPSTTKISNSVNSTYNFSVALYFNLCGSINMMDVTVRVDTESDVTGVVMYNPSNVNIESCSFIGSTDPDPSGWATNSSPRGGGGLVLELTSCEPGTAGESCKTVVMKGSTTTLYTFTNCTFANNSALSSSDDTQSRMDPVTGMEYNSFGKGGGLAIIIRRDLHVNSQYLEFKIIGCKFTNNFAQHHGGGLFVTFLSDTRGNSIVIQDCEFLGNSCPFSASLSSGGAVHVENMVYDKQLFTGNYIESWSRNTFSENSAYVGGALFLGSVTTNREGCEDCGLIIDTTFTNNIATFGSAVYIQRYQTLQLRNQHWSALVLDNCMFLDNRYHYPQSAANSIFAENGLGTVYSDQIDIWFQSSVLFENNIGSALVMVSAMANFSRSNVTFRNNTLATRGGAIALLGSSYIAVNNSACLLFECNSATYQGGAIYNQYLEPVGSGIQHADCFVKHENALLSPKLWEVTFIFTDNTIQINGGKHNVNAIHTTSSLPCVSKEHNTPLCWKGWQYDELLCEFESDYRKVRTKKYITTGPNEKLSTIANSSIIPGWPTAIHVDIHDDLDHSIGVSDSSKELFIATVDSTYTVVSTLDNFTMTSVPNKTTVPVHFESLTDRSIRIELSIGLHPCPPGFILDNGGCKCQDHDSSHSVLRCENDKRTAVLLGSYWMGTIENEGDYIISPCPLHLCKINNFLILPITSSGLSEAICKEERSGILCGECKKEFCLSVNSWSYTCIKDNGTTVNAESVLKYLSAVYLPYTAFLLIITTFHFKLTRGSLNGLVLFSQMITTTFDITQHDSIPLRKSSRFFPKTYRFLYGAFNLDFIEKSISNICFSSVLNTLSVLLLNYLLFVVPLLVVIIVGVSFKISRRFIEKHKLKMKVKDDFEKSQKNYSAYLVGVSKPLRENVILVLSTVVLLSYTKLSITCAQTLHVVTLAFMNGTVYGEKRVFIAGQMSVDGSYIKYQILAVLCAIYLSTLVLLLLDYPLKLAQFLAKKIHFLRAIYPSALINDFVHDFQSCYKPKFKFFAGLYFIFRFLAGLIFISNFTWIDKYLILELCCIVQVLLLVTCKPYKNHTHNLIDVFIFANLAIINGLNYYQNSHFQLTKTKHASAFIFGIQYVLSMIPIACFIFCACVKLAIRYEPIRRELQKLLLKVPNKRVLILHNKITQLRDEQPKNNDQGGNEDGQVTQPLIGKVNNKERVKERGVSEARNPDIPVTIINVFDKGMGEATTCQTRLSEGYYLKTEWSSEREDYGTVTKRQ